MGTPVVLLRRSMAFSLVLAGFGASAQSASPTPPLGLGDLLSLAERGNLQYAEGRIALERAQSSFVGARSKLLPRLGLESSASYGTAQDAWSSEGGLVLSQTLYDGGQSWSSLRGARLARERASIENERARESMALAVLRGYVECSRLEASRVASRRRLDLLNQQFDQVRRQFRQGLKTQRDYQLLEAEVERSRLELDTIENSIFKAYRDLENTLGESDAGLAPGRLRILSAESILSLKGWAENAGTDFDPLSQSPELRAMRLSLDEREIALDQARRQYWPVLNLNGNLSYKSFDFVGPGSSAWSDNARWNLGVGLSLNWTLWDWGGVSAQVAQAKAEHLIEDKRFEQKSLQLKNEFEVLTQNLRRQARVLEVQRKIRGLERASFRDIEKEYREGRSSYLDLITALGRDISAELAYENEAFAYFVAVAEVLELKGTLYESAKNL